MTGAFAVKPNDTTSPVYAEPFWGGYYGEVPSVRVFQVAGGREREA